MQGGPAPGGDPAAATAPATFRRAPRGGDPHLGLKLNVFSGVAVQPKWSFSTASRFTWEQQEKLEQKSKCSPALAGSTCLERSATPPGVDAGTRSAELPGGRFDASSALCVSEKAPRFEGSMDRFLAPRERVGHPRAKSYQPAETIGEATVPAYNKAPRYSFGGGKSRMSEQDDRREQLAQLAIASAEEKMKAMGLKPQQAHGRAQRQRSAPQLSRGFGSQVRLRHQGGAMQLPITPGPSAYEVPRDCDPVPLWSTTAQRPWGKRTAERPELRNPTATDVAPGEHTADHPFQASRPSPIFGHPLTKLTRDNFPDPAAYELPSSIGAGVAYSMAPSLRTERVESQAPGPGRYDPRNGVTDPHSFHATFGSVERRHASDEIDPDEPPGPGAHSVRRDLKVSDQPGARFGRDMKLKTFPGMGPVGFPGPGNYTLPNPTGRAAGLHDNLPRSVELRPGPGEYDPDDTVGKQAAPACGAMLRTAPRRTGFGQETSSVERVSEAMLRRCAAEVAQAAEEAGYHSKKEDKIAFVPSGPKFSFTGRGRLAGGAVSADEGPDLVGPISTIG